MISKQEKGISVIICCYNSALKLQQTLSHLANQQMSNRLKFEIVLVNNNSTDNTSEKAIEIWQKLNAPFPIKIVNEKKAGLNYAREKGISVAAYEYIILCDDDNGLCENYLVTAARLLDVMPEVSVIGGIGMPVLEINTPEWFIANNGFGYAVGSEGRKTGFTDTVYGAGMIIRKSGLQIIISNKIAFLLTDRIGIKLVSGGDTEICLLLKYSLQKIWFEESLTFKHYLPSKRINWKYYLKLRASFGKANAYLNLYDPLFKLPQRAVALVNLLRFRIRYGHLLLLANTNKKNKYADAVQQHSLLKTFFFEHKTLSKKSFVARGNIAAMQTGSAYN